MKPTLDVLLGDNLAQNLKRARVAVLGLGKSGIGAVGLLQRLDSKIFISDSQARQNIIDGLNINASQMMGWENTHSAQILEADLIVLSPGIRPDLPLLQQARARIPIWSELELAWRLLDSCKVAAVTGTNGKTTTVSWLADMARRDGKITALGGNIGTALSDFACNQKHYDVTVIEVSSYQLETIDRFCPDVAAVLNLTNDHLQRHGTMQNYAQAKARIFKNQTAQQYAVLNQDDAYCRAMQASAASTILPFSTQQHLKRGVYYDTQAGTIRVSCLNQTFALDLPVHLPGLHNIENACAAIACALSLGITPKAVQESLQQFKGVEHRIESVAVVNGVRYINDSKATNVDSTLKALQAIAQPLWLILGGQDKGAPYQPIAEIILDRLQTRAPIKGIFLIGESAAKIKSELGSYCSIVDCKQLDAAVRQAQRCATSGDVVLLSPACASFDQYKNFEHRGQDFKNSVHQLQQNHP